jgi:tight adherence protein C
MTTFTIVALSFAVVAGLTFAVGAALLRLLPNLRADRLTTPRLDPQNDDVSVLRWDERAASSWQRLVTQIGHWVTPRDAALFARSRKQLVLAGFHNPAAVALLLGSKATLAAALGISYIAYGMLIQRALPNVLPISLVLAAVGFFLPGLWLRLRTRQRQRAVTNALPDVLDLLMVCVEAGMGFDAAVARVAEQPGSKASPLHQELLRMHLEIRAGRPREEAMRALADRLGTEEIRSIMGSFIQTDRLGTSLGKTLRVQADASRVQRRHRAETKAQLAPLLMLGPTILFLLPSFMLVAMAPSFLLVLKIMGSLGK